VVTGLAIVNWLADAGVLTVSIYAAGAAVPWHVLLLAYGWELCAMRKVVLQAGSTSPRHHHDGSAVW
jgi:quercetin dioxygenase-like cupin family protein